MYGIHDVRRYFSMAEGSDRNVSIQCSLSEPFPERSNREHPASWVVPIDFGLDWVLGWVRVGLYIIEPSGTRPYPILR